MARTEPANRFDEVIDRRGTNSTKWDGAVEALTAEQAAADPLPMWVADMDFRAPPAVIDAIEQVARHGVFGYPAGAAESYLEAVTGWQQRRFGWQVRPEWVVPSAGILTAIKTVIQAFTAPEDSVLVLSPVYGHFYSAIELNSRIPIGAGLIRVGDGYCYDPTAFEESILADTKLFILCNPHNPTGNVWSADELASMGEICARHGVLVLADEVHQDLILNPGLRHVPFASLGESFAVNSITCTAASKTFNLAGMQCANVFIADSGLREGFLRQYDRNASTLVNNLGMAATQAAYTHGEPWLTDLLGYLRGNHRHFAQEVAKLDCGLHVLPTDSLYLAWMDCRGLGMDPGELMNFMLTKARLWLDDGRKFGPEGHGYMRVNLGCPRATIDEALERLSAAFAGL
ncbi:MAG: MalY/PatB family protein [Microthrixaceae bacterium]